METSTYLAVMFYHCWQHLQTTRWRPGPYCKV